MKTNPPAGMPKTETTNEFFDHTKHAAPTESELAAENVKRANEAREAAAESTRTGVIVPPQKDGGPLVSPQGVPVMRANEESGPGLRHIPGTEIVKGGPTQQ